LLIENDQTIIDEYCQSKSDRAATAFVRKHQKYVYSIALRYLKNHFDADDVAQETFIKALGSLSSFKGTSNIKTWLYRITVNMCQNHLRKSKIFSLFSDSAEENFFEIPSGEINAQEQIEKAEFSNKLMKAISTLPEKQRETFALRYFDELSYNEISEILGTSVGGLKANYFQAVKKITEIMKREV